MVAQGLERVEVVLIKPTHYDDDGFPYCFARGVLPSNTLAVVGDLVEQALTRVVPKGVSFRVRMFDETTRRGLRGHRALERSPRLWKEGVKVVVGLVGVQSSQFPRACDLISRWREKGAVCVIGGPHVSGTIATMLDGISDKDRRDVPCPGIMPPEIDALTRSGVVVFEGEAEASADGGSVLQEMLRDILSNRQKSLYRGGRPDITDTPLPKYSFEQLGGYVTSMDTLGDGRGCPHKCSFCSVINFQGRKIRGRDPRTVVARVEEVCRRRGKARFFLVDDNVGRNPKREQLLAGLKDLRRQGRDLSFMVQVDLESLGWPGFIEDLAEAGCGHVFVGVESLNDGNLEATRKRHNRAVDYQAVWAKCHERGVTVHASYMIGMPRDAARSVRQEIDQLFKLGADMMSLYICQPVPGSEDHARLFCAGDLKEVDLNAFDGAHPVIDHPNMSRQELADLFRSSWMRFYRVPNMVTALKRFKDKGDRQRLLCAYMWYRWAMRAEKTHAMIAGLYRVRPYRERRPISPGLSYGRYLSQEAWRRLRYLGLFLAEFYVFQHVYLETEFAPKLAEQRGRMAGRVNGFRDWWRLTFGDIMTRGWLNNFWVWYGRNRWKLLVPWHWWKHLVAAPHALSEVVYTIRFGALFRQLVKTANL